MKIKEEIIEKAKTDLTEIIKQHLLAVGGEEKIDVTLEYIDPEDYRVTTDHIKKVYVDEDGISELSKKLRPSSKISDYYDALAEFFKAGAKWMAEQGETILAEVYGWGDDNLPEICINPESVKPGDKVIVQIIKQE